MAALLASLVIAANTDNDAGIAALQTTQAYAIDQRLRFSRSFEAEADRIGMEIMVKAGMDPHATEQIFKQMERISRFSSEPPEFLLTHPLTNSRIVAAINDARQFKKKNFPENIDYQLVRARAILATQESPQQAISRFKSELSGFDTSLDGSQYGLAIAFTNNRQFQEADALINTLLDKHPLNTTLRIAKSNILVGLNQMPTAITLIQEQRKAQPEHHPLTMQLSQLHRAERKYSTAKRLLDELSEQRPNDPSVWYELAEVSGLDNDILLLHKARAEYFILYGDFANAEQQLNELATKTTEAAKNSPTKKTATLADYAQEKLRELPRLRRQAKL